MVYAYKKGGAGGDGLYYVPSDWSVIVSYNVGMFSGSIDIRTWV